MIGIVQRHAVVGDVQRHGRDDPAELVIADFVLAGVGDLRGDVGDLAQDRPVLYVFEPGVDLTAETLDGFVGAEPGASGNVDEVIAGGGLADGDVFARGAVELSLRVARVFEDDVAPLQVVDGDGLVIGRGEYFFDRLGALFAEQLFPRGCAGGGDIFAQRFLGAQVARHFRRDLRYIG